MARRWLYHLVRPADDAGDPYAPASLAREGFVHCSYRPDVAASARLHFPGEAPRVLRIDPRLLGVAVEEAATPRGPMPHVPGPIPRAAVAAVLALGDVADAPDEIG